MLIGQRLRLRPSGSRDRGLYRALYTCPEVMRAIAPPLTIEAADVQFERVLRHNALDTPGHRAWCIEGLANRQALGLTALLRQGSRAEFGIMLLPPAWRHGVATETLSILLPHAFGPLGLDLVDASRADDTQVSLIDRMFAPFGFARAPGLRPGEVGWRLPKPVWMDRSLRAR